MTFISSTGTGLLDRVAASRAALQSSTAAASSRAQATSPAASTRVSLGAANDVVYVRPATGGSTRAWTTPPNDKDTISTLMARNSGRDAHGLADRWRGLGGALLSQLAKDGTSYKQTLADFVPTVSGADGTDPTAAVSPEEAQAQALGGVSINATQVELKIQTRSGQTVQLKIAVNDGSQNRASGLEVEVTSSGTLSAAERSALSDLAGGLDRALEGLGQGAPRLDLSGLMNYDSTVLSSLDLKVDTPNVATSDGTVSSTASLGSFALHLGSDRKTVALKGASGELSMNVDATAPIGTVDPAKRQAAILKSLERIDAAAERGHADELLVGLFKDAFKQLQAPPADADKAAADAARARKDQDPASIAVTPAVSALSPALEQQVQPLRSGLADFDAHFSGDFEKTNRFGGVKEKGHAEYRIGQKTTTRADPAAAAPDAMSITQTQTETLDANWQKTRTLMLDTGRGNYDAYKVQDSKTVTTLIDTAKGQIARALRKTDEHSLKTIDEIENFRSRAHSGAPQDRQFVERLV
ncbi:hypothetical protein CDN99_07140 [Roseateles aquatilis]|uniref:Lactate dehydrogenase n=1 Tax=Roseateles aquatilis TaxID=431061 RepID=A0A246JHW8_9BURK|nr:hypothetical protein [Roseateles aquatilis]OWQ92120.1 hypothetical protein CDN99_07140 [Roseateles aquatilis]